MYVCNWAFTFINLSVNHFSSSKSLAPYCVRCHRFQQKRCCVQSNLLSAKRKPQNCGARLCNFSIVCTHLRLFVKPFLFAPSSINHQRYLFRTASISPSEVCFTSSTSFVLRICRCNLINFQSQTHSILDQPLFLLVCARCQ